MLDDLRNSSSFIDEEEPQEQETAQQQPVRRRRKETFLGMTAQQRFILSLMLFFMLCVLGVFALLISGSMVLPF
jgi:hypothetical protein